MESPDDLISRAEAVATEAHRGQVDKAGRDYIEHPRRVAANARSAVAARGFDDDEAAAVIAAAWLHDVVEDTEVTEADLRRDFPAEVVDAVIAVTKRAGEDAEDYFTRVRANRFAVVVKTADLADNTDPARQALLDEETRARLREKYRRAYELLGVEPR